jgi:hypothetical protein
MMDARPRRRWWPWLAEMKGERTMKRIRAFMTSGVIPTLWWIWISIPGIPAHGWIGPFNDPINCEAVRFGTFSKE